MKKEERDDWLGTRKCVVCGKDFHVMYPDMWTYKRWCRYRLIFLCSWGCMRAFDEEAKVKRKERAVGNRNQVQTGRELLEAMEAGEEPLEWLRKQGYINPAKAYQNIKEACKARAPEIAAKFPEHITKERAKKLREAGTV